MDETGTKTFVENIFKTIPESLLAWDSYSDLYRAIQDDDLKTFERKLVQCGKGIDHQWKV